MVLWGLLSVGVASAQDPSVACWDALLRAHVRDGVVDYPSLRGPARGTLDTCLARFASVSTMDGWTSNERMAFWINAYNAYTVLLIVQNPGIDSIRDIGWPLSSPWKQSIVPLTALRGHTLTLDEVEHGILRQEFAEPRVHMALVCASRSCPALRSEAYTAGALDAQLTDQARRFLADPFRNRLEDGTLKLSKIFDWYGGDFTPMGGVRGFVARYGPAPMAAVAATAPVDWLSYDWSLNGP